MKETIFVWVLSGALLDYQNNLVSNRTQIMSTNDLVLKRFWEIEDSKQASLLTAEAQECEEHYERKARQRMIQANLLSHCPSNMIKNPYAKVSIKLRDDFCRLNENS